MGICDDYEKYSIALCFHSPSLNNHLTIIVGRTGTLFLCYASRLRNISITTTDKKYVLFFPSTEYSIKKHCKWQKWTRILKAGTKANMYERNNRHIKMVAKLSFQPKEKEIPLVRVSTQFNNTGVE